MTVTLNYIVVTIYMLFHSVSVAAKPAIEVCKTSISGSNGEIASSQNSSCRLTSDIIVNYQPSHLSFEFEFHLSLPVDPGSVLERHNYVDDFGFGIVEGTVDLNYYNQSGKC